MRERLDVGVDHDSGEFGGIDRRHPTKNIPSLGCISDQSIDLGRAKVALVEADVIFPV